ncbi:uncharacterized protein LOC120806409 isoform X3 [Xiphias gladius]|nr:uncharacterized protein LOC120806409 isoform X3 [Xiphias gladius]
MQSTEFRVIHPLQPAGDLNSIRSAPHLLSPHRVVSPSADPGTQRRHRSFTPTETGPEYVNPDPNLPDSDIEDPGYITVIPDVEAPTPSSESRASTPSSDVRHDYVNLEEERDYLNVDPLLSQKSKPELLPQSDTDDDDDDDDDYEGNYVNQPPMIHSQLRA